MKRVVGVLFVFISILLLLIYLLRQLFFSFLNQMVVVATAEDPIHFLFHEGTADQINSAWDDLSALGYGKTSQNYLYENLFENTTILLIFIILIVSFAVFAFLYFYQGFKQRKKEAELLEALETGNWTNHDSFRKVYSRIHQQYRNKISSLLEEFANENEKNENIAHQIKSSLSTALLNTEMIIDDREDTLKRKDRIITQLERSNTLLDAYMEGHQLRNNQKYFNFQVSNLQWVINQAVDVVRGFAKEKEISFHIQTQKAFLAMDSFWMQEVIETILKNAIEKADQNSEIEIIMSKKEHEIVLSLTNTGSELPDQVDVFRRYETTQTSQNHHGIGLHMAKEIIEQHFGTIQAVSKDHQVSFQITLPIHSLETISY